MKKSYRPKSHDEISRNMAAIKSNENKTEVALRSKLHARGLRFRKYPRSVSGRPDIVFPKSRVAVFVDGDYWHARILIDSGPIALAEKVSRLSEPSRKYWTEKFTRRVQRDRQITSALKKEGWLVLRFWESDLRRDLEPAARRIAATVRRRSKQ